MESLIASLVTAIAGVLTRVGLDSRPNRLRRSIDSTLGLLEKARAAKVPAQPVADLEAVLAAETSRLLLIEAKSTERRPLDWGSFIVGLFFAAAAGIGAWGLIYRVHAWYWTTLGIVIGLLGLVFVAAALSTLFSGPRKKA